MTGIPPHKISHSDPEGYDSTLRSGALAYVPIVNKRGYTLGLAEDHQPGYWRLKTPPSFKSWEEASAEADRRNIEELKLTREEAAAIVLSTMGRRRR